MTNQLTIKQPFQFIPTTFQELKEYCLDISKSDLVPKDYKDKAANVLIAVQMGAELKLNPLQSVHAIAVINGRPCIWGDTALALVLSHPSCEAIKEWMEGSLEKGDLVAYCSVKRKNHEEEIRSFSIKQAIKAALWNKSGPWTNYPERMLQMRARGFALRDKFADALKGLSVAEEYDVIDINDRTQVQVKKVKELGNEAVKRKLCEIHVPIEEESIPINTFKDAVENKIPINNFKEEVNEAKEEVKASIDLDGFKKEIDEADSKTSISKIAQTIRGLAITNDQRRDLSNFMNKKLEDLQKNE